MEQLPKSNLQNTNEKYYTRDEKPQRELEAPVLNNKLDHDDAPLVDQALASVRNRGASFAEAELAVLREEFFNLRDQIKAAGIEFKTKAVDEVGDVVARSRAVVRRNPVQVVFACCAIALVIGLISGQAHRR